MQFLSVPRNSSEMSVDAAPRNQQFWGSGIPAMNKCRKPCSDKKSLPNTRWQYASVRNTAKSIQGQWQGALKKAAAQAVQLSSQGRAAEHMEAFCVSLRSSSWQTCFGKRWHQSKLKCSAKISFFFPNKPRICSNSRGTSTAFFFTSLSKSYKIKIRKYHQNSVQALHPNNTALSKVLKHPVNKHFKEKSQPCHHCCSCCYLADYFPGLPQF